MKPSWTAVSSICQSVSCHVTGTRSPVRAGGHIPSADPHWARGAGQRRSFINEGKCVGVHLTSRRLNSRRQKQKDTSVLQPRNNHIKSYQIVGRIPKISTKHAAILCTSTVTLTVRWEHVLTEGPTFEWIRNYRLSGNRLRSIHNSCSVAQLLSVPCVRRLTDFCGVRSTPALTSLSLPSVSARRYLAGYLSGSDPVDLTLLIRSSRMPAVLGAMVPGNL
jgi:hypothetical protein